MTIEITNIKVSAWTELPPELQERIGRILCDGPLTEAPKALAAPVEPASASEPVMNQVRSAPALPAPAPPPAMQHTEINAPSADVGPPAGAEGKRADAAASAERDGFIAPANAAAGANGAALAEQASAKEPSPDAPPLVGPHADIIALLEQDLATADVTRYLIKPLLERWPRTRGDPKHVLSKTAEKFKVCSRRKLEFARDFLLAGNHETFPDRQEIYAAIGRFDTDLAEKRREKANGGRP